MSDLTDFDLSMDDDMILDEIDSQVKCTTPVYNIKKNFLDILYKKYNAMNAQRISEGNDIDPESIEVNNNNLDNYYGRVIENMKSYIGIFLDLGSGEINYQTINSIYGTFVINLHRSMIEFIVASINTNKQEFVNQFNNDELKNLTIKMARKTYKNKIDATITVHIGEIINNIISDDVLLNPENVLSILYKNNPEDYDYTLAMNLFKVGYLSFDVIEYMKHIREIYSDPMNMENLKIAIMEELLPTFPIKTPEEIENEKSNNNQIVGTSNTNN